MQIFSEHSPIASAASRTDVTTHHPSPPSFKRPAQVGSRDLLHRGTPRTGAQWGTALALAAITFGSPMAWSAADICEGKAGPELIQCIERAARPPAEAARAAPSSSSSVQAPAGKSDRADPARQSAPDCTGKKFEELRSCLAAGGRMPPGAIAVPAAPAPAPAKDAVAAPRADLCDGKSGEEARKCIEAASKSTPAVVSSAPQLLNCSRYHAADQPLCVHRNRVVTECRNRAKYPDHDTCVRGLMANAPDPRTADCSRQAAGSRAQCEARNRVLDACRGERMGYFGCLEHKLGPDAFAKR